MLRLVIALLLVLAGMYFYLQDRRDQQAEVNQQKELVDTAKLAAQKTAEVSAAMAKQSDAIRDAAQGASPDEPGAAGH